MSTIEAIRRTSLEIHLEQRIARLENLLGMLSSTLSTNFPHLPGFYNQNAHYNGGVLGGISVPPAEPDDMAFYHGHGPRFVAKYNLLETNEQRRELLDTLGPSQGSAQNTHRSIELLHELRMRAPEDADWVDVDRMKNESTFLAEEWEQWHSKLHDDDRFIDWGKISSIKDFVSGKCPRIEGQEYLVEVEPDLYYCFKNLPDHNNEPKELILLPVPEIMGYLAVSHAMCTFNRNVKDWRVSPEFVIRWDRHELRWLQLPSSCMPQDVYNAVIVRWAKRMRYPDYVKVDSLEMMSTFSNVRNWIVDVILKEVDQTAVRKRVVSAGTELALEIEVPDRVGYDRDWKFYFTVLKGNDYIAPGARFRAAWHSGFSLADTVSLFEDKDHRRTNLLAQPRRQWADIHRMVNDFIQGLSGDWTWEDIPRNPTDH